MNRLDWVKLYYNYFNSINIKISVNGILSVNDNTSPDVACVRNVKLKEHPHDTLVVFSNISAWRIQDWEVFIR